RGTTSVTQEARCLASVSVRRSNASMLTRILHVCDRSQTWSKGLLSSTRPKPPESGAAVSFPRDRRDCVCPGYRAGGCVPSYRVAASGDRLLLGDASIVHDLCSACD